LENNKRINEILVYLRNQGYTSLDLLDELEILINQSLKYKQSLKEISDILEGENVTPLVENISHILGMSGIYN
jgi:hypothetical protein